MNAKAPPPMSEVVLDATAKPVADADQPPPKNGRARGGLFAKGNRIAKGNAKNKLASRWRNVVLDTFSVDDLAAIVAEIKRQALSGNTQAAVAVLRYIASDAMPKTTKTNRKGGAKA